MVTLTLKNLPDHLYQKLKQSATQNHRSLNREVIACLEKAVSSPKLRKTEILDRVRTLRQKTAGHVLSESELLEAKHEGRL
jgi:antitoxin FitA